MSSPLSAMTCLRVLGRSCWIRIAPMQALTLPYSDAFALAALLEVLTGIVYRRPGVCWPGRISGPLAAAIEADTRLPLVEAALRLSEQPATMEPLVARYISFRGYRDVAGLSVPGALCPDADGTYVATRWWTSERELADAHRLVSAELDAWYQQYYAHEEEGGPPPRLTQPAITMVMEATRPEWLAHMLPGMIWDSYCYDGAVASFP